MYAPAPGSPFPAGGEPQDLAVCDADGDGQLDILTANRSGSEQPLETGGSGGSVSMFLGDGTGGFRAAPGSPFPAGLAAHLIACGDVNGDGFVDVAVTSHDDHDIVILPGDGQGGLSSGSAWRVPASSRGEPHNHGLLLVDLEGDGDLDLVTTNQEEATVSVLHGDGDGRFAPAPRSPFPVGRMPYLPGCGDLNGDSRLDLVVPNARDGDVTVLLAAADGSFAEADASPVRVESRPYFAGLADLNGDGQLDLVTSHAETDLLTLQLADGGVAFAPAPASPLDVGKRGYKVRFGDLDLDGDIDLVTSGLGPGAVAWLGDGRGGFSAAPGSPFPSGAGSWSVALADLNGDGKLDIVTASADEGTISVLLAN